MRPQVGQNCVKDTKEEDRGSVEEHSKYDELQMGIEERFDTQPCSGLLAVGPNQTRKYESSSMHLQPNT